MTGPAVFTGSITPSRSNVPGSGTLNTVAAIANTSSYIGCAVDVIRVRSSTSTSTMTIITGDIGFGRVYVNRVRTGRKSGVFVTGVTGQSAVIPVSAESGVGRVMTVHRAGAGGGIVVVLVDG